MNMAERKMVREKTVLWNLIWLGIIVLIFFVMVGSALAQEPTPALPAISDDQVNAIAKQLFCPVCENIPLDVCPTQACAQWRELIREKLAAGWSEKQIKDYFVEQYGARVLGAPPAKGINWLVYVIPPVAILAGIFILVRALRSWRPSEAVSAAGVAETGLKENPAQPAGDYVRRLEEELSKRNQA
jgi:cytochrome c-type biogenesis protein CcmH